VVNAEFINEWENGFSWIARPNEKMKRTSHAFVDNGVWLVDPLDAENLDQKIEEYGEVFGIILLLDRHKRDTETLSDRYNCPVYVPGWMNVSLDAEVKHVEDRIPRTECEMHTTVESRMGNEACLYHEISETLIVADAVGTVDHFLARGERLGMNPVYRLSPPEKLRDFEPKRVLCGHGKGISTDAAQTLQNTVENGRRKIISAYINAARSML